MKKKAPVSVAERGATHRAKVAAEGGRQIAVFICAEADAKLAKWLERGETVTSAVNKLLKRSKP